VDHEGRQEERGAALITVLAFMVILLILVSTMLAVGSNEAVISGLQRDSVEALEHAQAGLEEAVRRIEAGRPYSQPFDASIAPGVQVHVVTRDAGPSGAFVEIRSDATVGRARRRLSTLALAVPDFTPPNIMFGYNFAEGGNAAEVATGDVYSQTYIEFVQVPNLPPPDEQYTYSGWAIIKRNPASGYTTNDPCYTHANCMAEQAPAPADRWYAGHRRTAYGGVPINQAFPNAAPDARLLDTVLNFSCSPPAVPIATVGANGPGYNAALPLLEWRADRVVDAAPPGAQVMSAAEPLYGCTSVPGEDSVSLPYTWVRENVVVNADLVPAAYHAALSCAGTCTVHLWFKTILFEAWFDQYWDYNESELNWEKDADLVANPHYGAVPPFPPFAAIEQNFDERRSGGGTINAADGIDFGQCVEGSDGIANNCDSPDSRPRIVLLDCVPSGSCTYTVNGNLNGHGLLLVDGNVVFNGTFDFWGTIIVNGNATVGSGNVTVYGGLVARSAAFITGNITINAGGMVANVIVGPATVTRRSWWER
jgi:hypothetical protein